MLLRIFKNNPVLLLIFSALFCVALWGAAMLHRNGVIFSHTDITLLAPFFDWMHGFPILNGILGFVLVLLIAGVWNWIVNKHSLLKQSTYFPFFFTTLLLSCRPTLMGFYPALIASFFLILFLDRMISSYKKEDALSTIFDAGLFIGIATLFYIPSIVFLLTLWVGLFTIRSISGREWVCSIIGFLLPFLFTFAYNLVFYPTYPWYNKITGEFVYRAVHLAFSWQQWVVIIGMLAPAAVSSWFFVNKASDNVLKAQKFWNLLLWFMLLAVGAAIICPVKDARALAIFAIPGSFVLSAYFFKVRTRLMPELLLLCLIGAVIISMFF